MAWTAPRTWVTGEIVTAAQMNEQVRDNEIYLKGETDKIDDCSYNNYSSSGRSLDSNYQNGSKIRIVIVGVTDTGTANWHLLGYIGTGSPASIQIAEIDGDNDYNKGQSVLTFVVPPSYWYRVYEGVGANFNINNWTEYDLH